MASIITATTTSGLTQSADNSGVLQLASGTGNLVTVPAVTGTAMVSGAMPAFRAKPSTAQTISHNTTTKVIWGTETYDTNNNFASDRFTPTVAGYYQFNTTLNILSTSGRTYYYETYIYKNGSLWSSFEVTLTAPSSTSGYTTCPLNDMVYCNGSTDYVEIYIYAYDYSTSGVVAVRSNSYFTGFLARAA